MINTQNIANLEHGLTDNSDVVVKDFKCIAVLGRKGGSGKTTLSSFLAHGASTAFRNAYGLELNVAVLRTDPRVHRPANIPVTRGYKYESVAGNDVTVDNDFIVQTVQTYNAPNNLLIYDGGANRWRYDILGLSIADCVVIPTGYSDDDMATATADYVKYTEWYAQNFKDVPAPPVKIMLNRWPGTKAGRDALMKNNRIREFITVWLQNDMLAEDSIQYLPSIVELTNLKEPKSHRALTEMTGNTMLSVAKLAKMATVEYAEHVWQETHSGKLPKLKYHHQGKKSLPPIRDYHAELQALLTQPTFNQTLDLSANPQEALMQGIDLHELDADYKPQERQFVDDGFQILDELKQKVA